MPDKVIAVPGVGNVAFPDTMSDDDISAQLRKSAAPEQPKSAMDHVANFAKNFWGDLANSGQALINTVAHPIDTITGIGAAQDAVRLKAQDALKRGDYVEAARHALHYAIPMVGPGLDVRGDQAQRGDVSGALGGTTSIATQVFGPSALESAVTAAPRVVSGVRTGADATKAALKAGGKDVVVGGGKTAAGVVLAKAGPLGEIADVIAGIPIIKSGLKQMGRGVRAGYSAGRDVLTAPAVEPPPGGIEVLPPERLQLAPGPTITPAPPAPPDPSFVRSVPAVYPTGPNPARALPAPANVIVPEAPPAPDASFVRAVSAEYPQVLPQTLRANPAAADIASQLEASMRAETITDYLARNKVPSSMIENFGPQEWKMVADQAGVQPPSPENIQAIRSNLAEYEGASTLSPEAGKMSPAELKADFQKRRAVRTARKGTAATPEPAPAAVPGSPEVPEPWRGTTPAAGPAAPTASAVRVEKVAQHLAESNIPIEDLANLPKQPGSLLQFANLARALKQGSPTAAEIPQIIDRVQELRGAEARN